MTSRSPVLVRTAGICCLLALGLVFGLGGYLLRTEKAAERNLRRDFDKRAQVAATWTGSVLAGSDARSRGAAQALYAGPAAGMKAAIVRGHTNGDRLVVFRADRSVLGADPASLAGAATATAASPSFALSLKTGKLTFAGVAPESAVPSVQAFQPFSTDDGVRVLAFTVPISQIDELFSSSLRMPNGESYIIDDHDQVILASAGQAAGKTLTNAAVISALRRDGRHADAGYYVVSRPVANTSWRVVYSIPEHTLMQPIRSTRRVAWQVFGAFAAAIVLLLLIGASGLVATLRLSHARLYDALTGLPNRSLFIDRTETVMRDKRRKCGSVAALFIDLDGFKPINDTYGHRVGDAVLQAVSARLLESLRPGDHVSRFGGDEFIVLCRGILSESDARNVAERIQRRIGAPLEIEGRTLAVGSSIGIALVDEDADRADVLIHNADLAMYKAKTRGRGGIERFTPDLALASPPA